MCNPNIMHNMQPNYNKIPMQPNMIVDQNNTIQNNKYYSGMKNKLIDNKE